MSRETWTTDPETSTRMKRIGRSATLPERRTLDAVRELGRRARATLRSLPGTPDVGSKVGRWLIFVHGCFWHGHSGCRLATVPTRNREAWVAKIEGNRARDRRVERALRADGYAVLVLWECETRDPLRLRRRLRAFFRRVDARDASA